MSSKAIPLSVLDLVPISSGSTPRQALANTVDLARRAEAAGYRRYWVAEHHLNPGVAGTSPALVVSLIANATTRIRVGSGAVQMGHHTPLSVVEQFGFWTRYIREGSTSVSVDPDTADDPHPQLRTERRQQRRRLVAPSEGCSFRRPSRSPISSAPPDSLCRRRSCSSPAPRLRTTPSRSTTCSRSIAGTYCSSDGAAAHIVPGEDAQFDIWILGSSGGTSAEIAGERGLPFAANYHVAPSSVLEAVEAYRRAFRPSPVLSKPHVSVSADVVVAATDDHARELATGYGLWVRSIRTAAGAIPFPTPEQARCHVWSDEDRALVQDRLDTQFVGSPPTVADQLSVLADETGADELLITTITHRHDDRIRSYQLLADEWDSRIALAHVS